MQQTLEGVALSFLFFFYPFYTFFYIYALRLMIFVCLFTIVAQIFGKIAFN